ncbi:hypothetical protein pb186bvf_002165 [Paramecium bursaria]
MNIFIFLYDFILVSQSKLLQQQQYILSSNRIIGVQNHLQMGRNLLIYKMIETQVLNRYIDREYYVPSWALKKVFKEQFINMSDNDYEQLLMGRFPESDTYTFNYMPKDLYLQLARVEYRIQEIKKIILNQILENHLLSPIIVDDYQLREQAEKLFWQE